MKIAIIADSLDIQNAGIHVYTKNMIESLRKRDNIHVTEFHVKENHKFNFSNEVIVPPVIKFLGKDPFRLLFSLPVAIKRTKPDIVIEPAHFGPFNLPRKIKRVTIIHDLTPVKFPQWHNFFSQILQRAFLPSILRRATLIITNSDNTQKDLTELYPFTKEKAIKINPGTDTFFKSNDSVNMKKEPFFLSVGTIEPRKNLEILIEAYKKFREKTDLKHKLIICGGKGWKNKSFYKKLSVHPFKNDIELRGYVDKQTLKKLYFKTTAFIYPSLYEGFGLPVLEAMSCGAPCIVSKSSSLKESGGNAALFFKPQDANELFSKMMEVAQSESVIVDMIEKGKKHSANFTWENYSAILEKELLKIYLK